jgi:predicted PurR-regulated permease PerM
MGNKTKIHPAVIILSVLAGGITFGLLGMLLAVPSVFLATGVLTLLYKSLKQFEII